MDTLEHLIDTTMLLRFGNGAVVPIGRATVANTQSIGALDTRVTALEQGGGGGGDTSELEARIDSAEQNILAIAIALAIEQGAAVDGTSDNIVVETFADTSGYIISSGLYDSTNHRIYA